MDLDIPVLVANLLFSAIGFTLFRYARSQGDLRRALIGVALMIYGYLMPNIFWTVGVGVSLCVFTYL